MTFVYGGLRGRGGGIKDGGGHRGVRVKLALGSVFCSQTCSLCDVVILRWIFTVTFIKYLLYVWIFSNNVAINKT